MEQLQYEGMAMYKEMIKNWDILLPRALSEVKKKP